MRKFWLLSLSVSAFLGIALQAAPPDRNWFSDAEKGVAEAKKKNQPMFVLFTGSDWCPPCKNLNAKGLKDKNFKKLVDDKAVLLYLDFPRQKKLPDSITKQNKEWSTKHGVKSYPTILILTPDGTEVGRFSGFSQTETFLKRLEPLLEKAGNEIKK